MHLNGKENNYGVLVIVRNMLSMMADSLWLRLERLQIRSLHVFLLMLPLVNIISEVRTIYLVCNNYYFILL